ncbi:MAG: hypothetical protein WBD18_09380, partial [Phycisphaerae bacterium]
MVERLGAALSLSKGGDLGLVGGETLGGRGIFEKEVRPQVRFEPGPPLPHGLGHGPGGQTPQPDDGVHRPCGGEADAN